MALGDSGKMTGCTATGHYLKDFVCVTCEGDDEFVDFSGLNCLRACAEGNYIFVDRNIKICHESIVPTCTSGVTAALDSTMKTWSLTCAVCAANMFVLDTSLFCIASCRDYFQSSGCTNNNTQGNGLCSYSFVSES